MGIHIVRADSSHASTIARFNQLMAEETEDKTLADATITQGVLSLLSDEDLGFYLVALTDDGHVTGCLAITYEWSDWRNGLFWWIQSVYVDKHHRGTGVFTALYAHVKDMALAAGNTCGIRLYVEKDNERAQRTYERLGMIETEYRIMEEEFR